MAENSFRPVNVLSTLNNDFSFIHTAGASSHDQNLDVVNAHTKDLEIETGGYPSPDFDSLFDEIQDEQQDSDSEFEDVVFPSRKRKRATNNSLAVGLDDGYGDIMVPTPAKRLQYNIKDKGICIGVWKNSPEPDPSRKHAVYGYLAKDGSLRRKIYPETPDGTNIPEGCPTGPSRCVTHEDVVLDLHLSALSSAQIKEFIQIRSAARYLNETPEEKRQADSLAVQEAIRNVVEQSKTSTTTPLRPRTPAKAKSQARNATTKDIRGVLLGFWKESDAPQDDNKHAAYGVTSGPKMRIKILRRTRDGRPYQGNWPEKPGAEWIAYENVVLEPALAKLTRTEVKEYVRLREMERQNGDLSTGIDILVLEKAKSSVAADARAKGMTVAQLDATTENMRKNNNERRKKARESDVIAGDPRGEDGSNGNFQENESVRGPVIAKLREDESGGMPVDAPAPPLQAKAIRSSKAESDARAERMKRAKDVLEKSSADLGRKTHDATNGQVLKETQRLNLAAQQMEQIHAQEEKQLAAARQKEREGREARRQASIEERRLLKEQKEKTEAKVQDAARKREAEAATAAARQQALAKEREEAEKAESARAWEVAEIQAEDRLKAARQREIARQQGKEAISLESARASEDAKAQDEETLAARKQVEEQSETARQTEISMLQEQVAGAREAARRQEEDRTATKRQADEREAAVRDYVLYQQQLDAEAARKLEEEAKERQAAELREAARLQAMRYEKEISHTLARSEHAMTEAIRDEPLTNGYNQANLSPAENGSLESPQTAATSSASATVRSIPQASPDIKWHKGVQYERKRAGPFAGKLVSKNPQVLNKDDEDYLEYRILIPWPCSNAISINGRTYGRKHDLPPYPFSADKMVSQFAEGLTIEGEDYLEYRVLKYMEF
jgi:hypothetical protein